MSISATAIIMAMLIIGVAAFLVSVITQATKNLGFLAKIPTDLQVIVLSMAICLIGYFSYTSYTGTTIVWYYIAGIIIGSFIVALVARDGWSTVTTLINRFVNTSTATEIAGTITSSKTMEENGSNE